MDKSRFDRLVNELAYLVYQDGYNDGYNACVYDNRINDIVEKNRLLNEEIATLKQKLIVDDDKDCQNRK